METWIVPTFCSRSSPHRALITRRCLKLDQEIFFKFKAMLLSANVETVTVSRMQDFLVQIQFCKKKSLLLSVLLSAQIKRFSVFCHVLRDPQGPCQHLRDPCVGRQPLQDFKVLVNFFETIVALPTSLRPSRSSMKSLRPSRSSPAFQRFLCPLLVSSRPFRSSPPFSRTLGLSPVPSRPSSLSSTS